MQDINPPLPSDPIIETGIDPRSFMGRDPEDFRIPRVGARDLSFTGWRIGQGEARSYQGVKTRIVAVDLYVTSRGRYIGIVQRCTDDLSEIDDSEWVVTTSGEELLAFLEQSGGERLGRGSREAWNQACTNYPPLAPLATERVE
jgi:hypothetical protein